MKKIFIALIILTFLIILYLYVANLTLMPKSITLLQGEKLELATLWGINLKQKNTSNINLNTNKTESTLETSSDIGQTKISEVRKNKYVTVNVIPKTTVIPLGNAIGLKLYTEGVLVVGMSEIEGIKPYENTGIEEGDRITYINNKKISNTEDLIQTVNSCQGKQIEIKYVSNDNEEITTNITPKKTKDNQYKLGLWVRDAAAGVGTATFYEPSSGMFASLGHGITDIDTGGLITIANGELVNSNIISIVKGEKGRPGEIRGSIEGQAKLGDISKNTSFGIFGKISNESRLQLTGQNEIEVLARNEIKKGKAHIICELENGIKDYYTIEIQRIFTANNNDNKSMLIKITDQRLLDKTGGIIQGMSGSPIIQDGKFVGAVTHVLVNDPTTGYAVFADMMLKQMKSI